MDGPEQEPAVEVLSSLLACAKKGARAATLCWSDPAQDQHPRHLGRWHQTMLMSETATLPEAKWIFARPHVWWKADCHEALVSYEASEALLGEPAGADVCRVRDGCLVIVKHGLSFSWRLECRAAPPPLTEGNDRGPSAELQ